ncbi:MAG TPA: PhoU domain-containing protein [Candidatus Krumholzibacteria bacterium]|nr:PhoU domain-containing protein [Candidatus Krumholzibacteria bacterium]
MRTEKAGAEMAVIPSLDGIDKNLRFLIHEVRKQLVATAEFLEAPTPKRFEGLLAKDDYIDNLKDVILRKCFSLVPRTDEDDQISIAFLKAVDVVTVNLERIADFCENIVGQTQYIEPALLTRQNMRPFFEAILDGIDRIGEAILRRDARQALEICRAEHVTDRLYVVEFRRLLREMESGTNPQGLVTSIFIYRYLERMGDSLLNIGEAILSAALGERIKIDQWRTLEELLGASGLQQTVEDLELEPLAETRSGCKVGRVRTHAFRDEDHWVVFKEGRREKLLAEKEATALWEEIMPGLAPRIHAFHDRGPSGSILFEYLSGHTFEEYLLRGDLGGIQRALESICRTLSHVWERTRKDTPVSPRFAQQLAERLGDVYSLHPGFQTATAGIGRLALPSFDTLVEKAKVLEAQLVCPFSVFTHGDFNVDNVICHPTDGTVHFIDLHRSRTGDYLQDVSVFLVSNHRLQVFDEPIRQRIRDVTLLFHDFARETGQRLGDPTFSARLALGLARSFATSTRFVLDHEFAKNMFLRSRYLLEAVLAVPDGGFGSFEIPREVLVD